jgi:hypothetical protein
MSVVQLVLGVALLALAATLLVRREALTDREASRGRVAIGTAGWTVAGGILALAGLLQLALAVL